MFSGLGVRVVWTGFVLCLAPVISHRSEKFIRKGSLLIGSSIESHHEDATLHMKDDRACKYTVDRYFSIEIDDKRACKEVADF